jgi:hypothetical protein
VTNAAVPLPPFLSFPEPSIERSVLERSVHRLLRSRRASFHLLRPFASSRVPLHCRSEGNSLGGGEQPPLSLSRSESVMTLHRSDGNVTGLRPSARKLSSQRIGQTWTGQQARKPKPEGGTRHARNAEPKQVVRTGFLDDASARSSARLPGCVPAPREFLSCRRPCSTKRIRHRFSSNRIQEQARTAWRADSEWRERGSSLVHWLKSALPCALCSRSHSATARFPFCAATVTRACTPQHLKKANASVATAPLGLASSFQQSI